MLKLLLKTRFDLKGAKWSCISCVLNTCIRSFGSGRWVGSPFLSRCLGFFLGHWGGPPWMSSDRPLVFVSIVPGESRYCCTLDSNVFWGLSGRFPNFKEVLQFTWA